MSESALPPRDDYAAWYKAKQEALAKARADGVVDWLDADQILREIESEPLSRHSMDVVFTLTPSALHEGLDDAAYEAAMNAELDVILAASDIEREPEYRATPTGAGRGASWATVAMLVGSVAVVGPPFVNAWFDLARNTASLWKRLRNANHAPLLSKGALVALCIEDLRARTQSDLADVILVSATDTGPRDLAHSGRGDPVLILFASIDCTWLYLVDASGHVLHFSQIGRLGNGVTMFAGLEYQETEPEHPMLLDNEATLDDDA